MRLRARMAARLVIPSHKFVDVAEITVEQWGAVVREAMLIITQPSLVNSWAYRVGRIRFTLDPQGDNMYVFIVHSAD